jgi:hypothetical protein
LKKQDNSDSDQDTIDAFVALGGDTSDEKSHIDGDKLIDIIKNQFKMTIDIEKMIDDVDDVTSPLIRIKIRK